MSGSWLARVKAAEKTALVQDGKRKVHYKFPDGEEMAEEYNLETSVLIRRAWKLKSNVRKMNEWEVEVGDPEFSSSTFDNVGFRENPNSPYLIKRITKNLIEWRIRNLPYPIETYSVTVDPENYFIIVRTSNKKYYKKIPALELQRACVLPKQSDLDFHHKLNTLIITYKKPAEVLQMEKEIRKEIQNLKGIEEGDIPNCKQS